MFESYVVAHSQRCGSDNVMYVVAIHYMFEVKLKTTARWKPVMFFFLIIHVVC